MNKGELIDTVASCANLSKGDARRAIECYHEAVKGALIKGERVALVEFGSFSVSKRHARTGRNPQTGQPITIAAKKVVKFKAGSYLADSVQ